MEKKRRSRDSQRKNRAKKENKQTAIARKKQLRRAKRIGQLMAVVFVLSCLGFLVFIQTHRVDGQSMKPTLQDHDRLFVRKNQTPERYDLITFTPPNNPKESYVKRVIGLPGDRIWVDNNSVYLNQSLAEEDQVMTSNQFLSGEDLPDGTIKVWVTEAVAKESYSMRVIPADHYFVLGDNRNHSTDSRHFGLVKKQAVEGVVTFRYYPVTRLGGL